MLDADEQLALGSAEALRAALANPQFDCGMLRLHEARHLGARLEDVVSGKERQADVQLVPRLLRRADGLAYTGAIHETVAPWLRRRGTKVAGVDANIVHSGATRGRRHREVEARAQPANAPDPSRERPGATRRSAAGTWRTI